MPHSRLLLPAAVLVLAFATLFVSLGRALHKMYRAKRYGLVALFTLAVVVALGCAYAVGRSFLSIFGSL